MKAPAATWSDLWRVLNTSPRGHAVLRWSLALALPPLILMAPLPALALAAALGIATWMWRDSAAAVLLLVALMANTKIHLFVGLTLFPEYPVILIALLVMALKYLEGEPWVGETRLMLLFVWFTAAGFLSFVNAIEISRVFTKGAALLVDFAVFAIVLGGLRRRNQLDRAIRWMLWLAAGVAVYGMLQVLGLFMGFDVNPNFMEKHGNPEFYYGIGTPVIHRFAKFFRANALFNDSNILAGYLAAMVPMTLALLVHDVGHRRRWRSLALGALLFLLVVTMFLTLSRSGLVALAVGVGVVLAAMPQTLRSPVFWTTCLALVVAAVGVSAAVGGDPWLLWVRMGETFNMGDFSSRQHLTTAGYALNLLTRFPLTGVGLRQFGYYYAADVDPFYPNMIAHNVFLSHFAEMGLLGGIPFLLLVGTILWRSLRAVRDPRLRGDATLHAWNVGFLGGLVALAVSNSFYDFYTRTFTWVFSGMAIVAARLWERRSEGSAG